MMKRKYNLLIVGNPTSGASTEAFLRKFLNVLDPLSKNVYLISGDLPSEFNGKIHWTMMDAAIKKKSSMSTKIINFILANIKLPFLMIRAFRKDDFKIIIFLTALPIPMLFAKLMKKKILLHRGGSFSKERNLSRKSLEGYFIIKIFEDLPCILSDKLIVESINSLKFQNIEKYRDKVVFCSLYIDSGVFRCTKEIKERKNVIGLIGTLNENKGADKFCKAIIMMKNYLKEKDVEIIIGGNGPLFDSLKKIIETGGISKRVTFTGWIPHEKLFEYLNELKLLVLPSFSEATSYMTLEAMACGTPVLATSVGGIPDVIKDGETGFIMENNSPECIVKNVKRVLEHPDLDRISESARKLIERKFTYEVAVECYKEMLDELSPMR